MWPRPRCAAAPPSMPKTSLYEHGLDKNAANYAPLSPISLIARTAYTYPRQLAVVHGERRYCWDETYARSRRLASALARARHRRRRHGGGDGGEHAGDGRGAFRRADDRRRAEHAQHAPRRRGDRVHAAPWRGAGAHRPTPNSRRRSARRSQELDDKPLVIDIDDPLGPGGARLGGADYEAFIAGGDPDFAWQLPADEWEAISLNYTSGTTGNPKGVVYHHRGAYLNALSNIIDWGMPRHSVYLWTLPMFHCNGWCFPWTMAANAGTNVCLRKVEAKPVFDAIRTHRVTHYCGAPIVHAMLINAPAEWKQGIDAPGQLPGRGGGAAGVRDRGHGAHGLRHHPRLRPDRDLRPGGGVREACRVGRARRRRAAERNGRQGVRYTCEEGMTVMDPTR